MGKVRRYSIQLKNGQLINDLEELQAYFELDTLLEYYIQGKLVEWLRSRGYVNEADSIQSLDQNSAVFERDFYSALHIPFTMTSYSLQHLQNHYTVLQRISGKFEKALIDSHPDAVAVNQSELDNLIKDGKREIVLVQGEYHIPDLPFKIKYIGVGSPTVTLAVNSVKNSDNHPEFEGCRVGNVPLSVDKVDEGVINLDHVLPKQNPENVAKAFFDSRNAMDCLLSIENTPVKRIGEKIFRATVKTVNSNIYIGDVFFPKDSIKNNGFIEIIRLDFGKDDRQSREPGIYQIEFLNGMEDRPLKGQLFLRNETKSLINREYYEGKLYYDKGDYCTAISFFMHAAERNHSEAMLMYGFCAYNGYGITQDIPLGLSWIKKAAECGNENACFNLGQCYEDGLGVEKNASTALFWYKKAIALSHSVRSLDALYLSAKNIINHMDRYEDEGVLEAGKIIFDRANEGDSRAMIDLAELYSKDSSRLNIKQNDSEVVKWTKKAANKGDKYAQKKMAEYYLTGYGVQKDFNEAKKWAAKAGAMMDIMLKRNRT